jgi:flavin reductase (DIM6/NTAB) family NADH-FMN oxidoreductase RutF
MTITYYICIKFRNRDSMISITPGELATSQLHAHLLSAISPRPICFASTIDADGNQNLSPFSYFNVFGSNPVTFVFSPARRVRDNTTKHTLQNCLATKEVVINIVNYSMVQQMSVASCDYPAGTNEFEKSGFTPLPSDLIKPMRVAESPVQFECVVKTVIETGEEGGAGNLIVCEMVKMHINENILDETGMIDPNKIDTIGRMGRDWYVRASGNALFEVAKPNANISMGVNALPDAIRHSKVLTGNNLGMLAYGSEIPELDEEFKNVALTSIMLFDSNKGDKIHLLAKTLLDKGDVDNAWQVLLRGV